MQKNFVAPPALHNIQYFYSSISSMRMVERNSDTHKVLEQNNIIFEKCH